MLIRNPRVNCVLIALANGSEFLFSYGKVVAGFIPGIGHFCADVSHYSIASNLHMAWYFSQAGATQVTPIPQVDIERITKGI